MEIYNAFSYQAGQLACEDIPLHSVAERHGTPAYVYSKAAIVSRLRAYRDALLPLPHKVCFAVKANSNLAVLQILASKGAGFDIVSGGELERVLRAGGDPHSVVFSGVGKTEDEIRFALDQQIHSFNCESQAEIELISQLAAARGRTASIAIRVNPDVDAGTHPYISTGLREHKFGVSMDVAPSLYQHASQLPGISPVGVSCHIGSQLLDVSPMVEAARKMIQLCRQLRESGIPIQFLDLGGGLGVPYRTGDQRPSIGEFLAPIRDALTESGLMLMVEPGRSIVAEAGVLLTRVLLIKENGNKTFIIADAAMNDLLRPALYQAYHDILPVQELPDRPSIVADVVGPVCETGDFLARSRKLPQVHPGDLLAIATAGGYGFTLASNYNSRPRACEVIVDGRHLHLARRRETYEDLVRGEQLI